MNCAVFYRMREGVLAEFIGIEPVSGDMHVLKQTRYLAARLEDGPAIGEAEYTGEDFYGGENWPFTGLHNPFVWQFLPLRKDVYPRLMLLLNISHKNPLKDSRIFEITC